jgi:UDP-2-acetamido-3-amino-2,3-dideoxy-glucuronate N-acetyltransferase
MPKVGKGTKIWDDKGLWGEYEIGSNCVIGKFVEIGKDVKIGNNCKVEAFAFIPPGVTIEDDVFVGPHVCFTNDKRPKAVGEWKITKTLVRKGAAIGANSTIVCGVTIGENALVGAGSVVTKDVPKGATVVGNPAKVRK